jgi:succinate-semialdehyde dehydrogenase / glutarate-semialdehyde dehydrogenase
VVDPATEQPIGRVAAAGVLDVDDAVAAAAADFPAWARRPAHERGDVLKHGAALLAERADDVARILAAESGKTLPEAAAEVGRAVETLAWNGEEAGRVEGRVLAGKTPGAQRLSLPTPLGVVAAFAAWNFPAVLAARKLGAILAAGCTAVLKAAEATPGTAAEVVRALAEAGAPVNLLFGDPAVISRQLIGAPEVRAVTFTGSTRVGRIITGLAAEGLKRTVLELGGHAPVIVAADADLELAVTATLPAKFGSAGQSCVAPSRYLVHASRHEEFTARFTAAAQAQQIGPVIGPDRLDALAALTQDALARGAELRCGGERGAGSGYFWPPTVLANVPAEAEVMREEPFGPLAVINPFDTLEEAIAAANSTEYAFAAYLFTDSLVTRRAVLRDLRASNIGINQMAPSLPDAPLGGMQDSGLGYEGGRDGIAAFQHRRLVSES